MDWNLTSPLASDSRSHTPRQRMSEDVAQVAAQGLAPEICKYKEPDLVKLSWKRNLEIAVSGKRMVILGIGNELKGDDALGKYVTDRLGPGNVFFCSTMPENFISRIRSILPDVILFIDAVDFGGEPGGIIFAEAEKVFQETVSTHSLSLELFSKCVPGSKIYLLGVQPKCLDFGALMSEEATKSANEIILIVMSCMTCSAGRKTEI